MRPSRRSHRPHPVRRSSSGVVPVLAHSANEVRYGWGDVQMPYTVAWASGARSYPAQRWPPVLRDNRFSKDRHRRVYICDHCNAHVPWSGQAKAFDGAYLTYDNKTPIQFLPQQWEQGRDFRWFCTMCYARWWNMNDLGEVRKRLGLMAKVETRKARAEK